MRIAVVLNHPSRDLIGSRREVVFSEALTNLGHKTRLFRIAPAPPETISVGQGISQVFCAANDPTQPLHRQVSETLRTSVAQFRPDLILFKGMRYDLSTYVHAGLPSVPYGFIVGGSVSDPILKGAAIVLGEYQEQMERRFKSFMSRGRAFVVPKYLDPSLIGPRSAAHRDIDIINVGSLNDPRKNQEGILPFAKDRSVVCVGWGTPDEAIASAGVTFSGKLSQPVLFDYLWRSKLMVHTSLMDGLPRSVVEAMVCGVPVVCYRDTIYGGFRHGEHGFFADQTDLRSYVDLCLSDDAMREEMSRAARSYALENHGVEAIHRRVAEIEPVLHSLIRPNVVRRLQSSAMKRALKIFKVKAR